MPSRQSTMGLAVYPKPRLSVPGTVANAWPYLLGSLRPAQPDVAWATDITYIRLQRGFCYLCAIMPCASRLVSAIVIIDFQSASAAADEKQAGCASSRAVRVSQSADAELGLPHRF